MKFPPPFLAKYFPAPGRHRGRSAAARNARANLVAVVGVVGVVLAAVIYAVAISDGAARPEFEAESSASHWWSAEQARRGAKIYARHCAECHDNREAANPWRHDLGALRRIVRFGRETDGEPMPAFQDRLSPEDIDAVLAHMQSLWPEEVYFRWRLREQRRQR